MTYFSVETVDDFNVKESSDRIEQFEGMRWDANNLIVIFTTDISMVCCSTKEHYQTLVKQVREAIADNVPMLQFTGHWYLMDQNDWDRMDREDMDKDEELFFKSPQFPTIVI